MKDEAACVQAHGTLVQPHGEVLVNQVVAAEYADDLRKHLQGLLVIPVNERETSDLVMLGTGAYSPLQGFMDRAQYQSVLSNMALPVGFVWSIPITLSVTDTLRKTIGSAATVALASAATGELLGELQVEDLFESSPAGEALAVFGTTDQQHPGVQELYSRPRWCVGGRVQLLPDSSQLCGPAGCATPQQTRELFGARQWRSIVGFQTRNPLHRSHEYLIRVAAELHDGVLLHPIAGPLKHDDIPTAVRMQCYRAVLESYLPHEQIVLQLCGLWMRYAGPREAVHHAIVRQNFGCSHFIVGRDHAGVSEYYRPLAAQEIFEQPPASSLKIVILSMDSSFWCQRCQSMATRRTCPHAPSERIEISGRELRRRLAADEAVPPEFSRPEVIEILKRYYSGLR